MKIDKMFHIRLREHEVKSAILQYIKTHKIHSSYIKYLEERMWDWDFEGPEIVVMVDGSVECDAEDPL